MTVTQLATAVDHCQPRGATRGITVTNPSPDIVIVLLRRDEADVGFAIRSPPAQATIYSPADHHVVLGDLASPYVGASIGHSPRESEAAGHELGRAAHDAAKCGRISDMSESQPATVAGMWRYPVKSMRGERIEASDVADTGFRGDRAYAVVDLATGKVGSAKHPRRWGALLECEARYVAPPVAGAPLPPVSITLPDGTETASDDPRVGECLTAVFGRAVQLTTVAPDGNAYQAVWPEMDGVMPDDVRRQTTVAGDEPDGTLTELSLAVASAPGTFFDVAALHVLTTSTLRHLGELEPDHRFEVPRYRPNIVIEVASAPFAENGWSGGELQFGAEVTASALIPTMRCIMTTLAQGDLPRDNEILRAVTRHNRIEIPGLGTWSCVGAYAAVTAPGRVHLGDAVAIRPAP
jgi:hypothetical protein